MTNEEAEEIIKNATKIVRRPTSAYTTTEEVMKRKKTPKSWEDILMKKRK